MRKTRIVAGLALLALGVASIAAASTIGTGSVASSGGTADPTAVIAIYDASGNLLGQQSLTFFTIGGTSAGEMLGFSDATANISSFTLSNDFIAITDLTVNGDSADYVFPTLQYFGLGPQTFGPSNSVTWSSTHVLGQNLPVFGYTGAYNFAINGGWNGLDLAGLNQSEGSMTFTFASPVSSVYGLIDYSPSTSPPPTPAPEPSSLSLLVIGLLGVFGPLQCKHLRIRHGR